MNTIIIQGLEVQTCVGVPDKEREHPQKLLVNAILTPTTSFSQIADDIRRTIDYDKAARRISELATARPRHLIETLAMEIAEMLLSEFPASRAEIEVRKFILPQVEYVAARCIRECAGR